jgi:hypothetical protein
MSLQATTRRYRTISAGVTAGVDVRANQEDTHVLTDGRVATAPSSSPQLWSCPAVAHSRAEATAETGFAIAIHRVATTPWIDAVAALPPFGDSI